MSKTANIVLLISTFLLLNAALALANDDVEFKYIFSDQFFTGENPLGKEIDPDLAKAKEAVITACKAWEAATGGSIKLTSANNPDGADIIFEGWSLRGPGVSIQDEKLCLDENDIGNLFSEYMPEALGFTIFDDCNSDCRFPESWDPADADNNHRARIFFHKKTAPWFCVLDEEKVLFDEAQRDVIRVAMREIGHALGFCEYPDGDVNECGLTPPCIRNSASIMCKNQVRCLEEVQDGSVPLGGMDDVDHPGVRDLTRYDKESVLKKFFPGTKILYGRVQDADGNPIPEAVLSTDDGKFSAKTNSNGIYSLWHIVPGTYFIRVHHPENDQDVAEIIGVSPAAPDMAIKDFKFTKGSQGVHGNTRVVPSVGGPDDIYTVVATFPGAFDEPPGSAKLFLDGQLVNEVSIPFTTGPPPHVFSYYGLAGLKPGEHYYEFKVAEREGDRQQTLNGSFKVSRPTDIQFAVESSPSIVSVGKDNHATVSAQLKDKNGEPLAGETVRFQTSFPGFFTPSSGEVVTNVQGIAEIIFTPGSSGNATLTAIPPNGPSVTTSISCTSQPISIALEFHSAGKNSFKVISSLDYFTDKRPVAGEAVKWRLQPSEGCTWEKGPDQKTDPNGKAFGTLTIGTDESRRVSVTTTHIPTGTSGTGSFVFRGSEKVQIQPARNLGKATEPCEWSTNGFFAVRHANGSGLSIYRVSDWRKVWSKRRSSGKYHSFSFSPNGMKLAAGVFTDKDEIAVLNVPAGNVDDVWDASVEGESKTTDRSFVWNGSDIYAIQNDNVIRKWSVSGSLEMDFAHDAEIEEFRFNPAVDSQFAALDKNGVLKIWDKNSAAPVKTVNVESVSTGRLKCLAWSRDGKKLVVGSGMGDTGGIYTFDTSSWSTSGFDLPGLGKVNSLDYNNDSSRLAVGHDKGLMVLNTKTFSVEYYNTAATNHVRWSPDGAMLAAGGQVYFFNDANFNGPKIEIAVPQSNASFSADSTEIEGKITGLHKIRSAGVFVNGGEPEALALGSDGAFKKRISLKDGQNTILIQAEDLLKNTASFSMSIGRRADSTPPALTEANVGSAIGVKGTPIHFSVRVLDGDSGIDTSKVTAGTRLPEGDTGATVQLYDDGEHEDKEPGDGLFANWWNSSEAGEGFHAVDFYA
ncbi:MAG: carboxypeptidase regulatory-like domain-containing protein, partial [Desulfobacterales bacterium]